MSHQIGGIDVEFAPSNRSYHNYWTDYKPSSKVILPKGWQREKGFRALSEPIIWEKDVPIPMRDGTILRGDIFRPLSKGNAPLPALLPWSPYGKTGSGQFSAQYQTLQRHSLTLQRSPSDNQLLLAWCPQGSPQWP